MDETTYQVWHRDRDGNIIGGPYPSIDALHEAAHQKTIKDAKRERRNRARRDRHAVLTSLGLKRVRGSLGGIYYE